MPCAVLLYRIVDEALAQLELLITKNNPQNVKLSKNAVTQQPAELI